MEYVRGHLLLTNCLEDEVTRPNIELALKENRFLAAMDDRIDELQDMTRETERYVRDLYDHLIRISWRGPAPLTFPVGSVVPSEEGALS